MSHFGQRYPSGICSPFLDAKAILMTDNGDNIESLSPTSILVNKFVTRFRIEANQFQILNEF